MKPTDSDVIRAWCQEAQATSVGDNYAAKRCASRYDWVVPLEMKVGNEVVPVRSCNISSSGIAVVCRRKIEDAEPVLLRRDANGPWIKARVTHVTQTVGAFLIGVRFDAVVEPDGTTEHKPESAA